MKNCPDVCSLATLAITLMLGGCGGPIVRTITVAPAEPMGSGHPSVVYNLKRTRLDLQLDVKLVRVLPYIKRGDDWVPLRSQVSYYLDFANASALSLTPSYEDDPRLAFAIRTDSAESTFTNIKNFEIKVDGSGTLQSVNAEFEDTTLKVAENAVRAGVDIVKFASNVALTAAAAVKSTDTTKVEETALDSLPIKLKATLVLTDFTAAADGRTFTYDLLPGISAHLDWAKAQLLEQHKALNVGLMDDVKKTAGKKELMDINEPAKLADAAGLAPSYFFPTDKVTVSNTPVTFTLGVDGDVPSGRTINVSLTAREVVEAAISRELADAKETPTNRPDSFGGVFYRRAGSGRLRVAMVPAAGAKEIELVAQRIALPEAGFIAYSTIDARLFTNRNATVTFGADGQLASYKLVASSGAEALSKALADQTTTVLSAAQDIKKQRQVDAEKAKTAIQDTSSQHLREVAQGDLIFGKDQEIAAQQRVVERTRVGRDAAKAKLDKIRVNLDLDLDKAQDDAQRVEWGRGKAAAEAAKDALATADDNLFNEEAKLARLKRDKNTLQQKLEAIKMGANVTLCNPLTGDDSDGYGAS